MAQTKLNFAIKESTSDVPTTGGEIVQSSATEEQTTNTNTNNDANTGKTTGSANTGLFTSESGVSTSVSSFSQEPLIFGSLLFVGIVIFFAFLVKLKTRKQLGFKKSMVSSRHTTTILGFLSLLMIFAGAGGAVSKFIGSSATSGKSEDITTSSTVDAELIETGVDYKLYCGVDTITINKSAKNGFILHAYSNNGARLVSSDNTKPDIVSISSWQELPKNSWGFKTNYDYYEEITEGNQYKPVNLGNGVIAQSIIPATAGEEIEVTYCAKTGKETIGNFSDTVNYEIELLNSTDAENFKVQNGTIYRINSFIDYDLNEDEDGDGLTNREENRLGLDPMMIDGDNDGLFDNEELEHGTNPFNDDTDDDGLLDYSEIALELDPLKSSSENDGILDGERETTYTYDDEYSGIKVEITGTGNTPIFTADAFDDAEEAEEESSPNLLSTMLNFYTEGEVREATIELSYTDEQLADTGLSEENMAIYYYDEDNEKAERIDTTVDPENKTLTATVDHFSKYFVHSANEAEISVPDPTIDNTDNGLDEEVGAATTVRSTKGTKLKYNNDNTKDTVVADSTFRSQYHGFKFRNIATDIAGGNCYGMSKIAELRFLKKLPTKTISAINDGVLFFPIKSRPIIRADINLIKTMIDIGANLDQDTLDTYYFITDNLKSYAFNLSGTNYGNYNNNLQQITIKTDTLKYSDDFRWSDLGQRFNDNITKEYAYSGKREISWTENNVETSVKVDTYAIDSESESRERIRSFTYAGLSRSPLLYEKYITTSLHQLFAKGRLTKSVIDQLSTMPNNDYYGLVYHLSIHGMNSSNSGINNEDKQILNAINYYQFTQKLDHIFLNSSLTSALKTYEKNDLLSNMILSNWHTSGGKIFVNTIKYYLNKKDPLTIIMDVVVDDDGETGEHAVNATRLIQDGKNANKYYLEVYDNNFPRDTMVVTLNCSTTGCSTSDYRFADNGKRAPYQIYKLGIAITNGQTMIPL